MFSKKTFFLLFVAFVSLSIMTLVINMPQKKNRAVMLKLKPYIPYELTKTFGGLDIIDKHSGKRMKIDNSKVFIAFDKLIKDWGKTHLKIENKSLLIFNDSNKTIDSMKLNAKEESFVHKFFNK